MKLRHTIPPIVLQPLVGTFYAREVAARRVAAWLVCQLLLAPALLPAFGPGMAHAQTATLTSISTIQGAGPVSPFDGQLVTTWGLVTGVTTDGFYLQDPAGDGDVSTSDGLYAFTYTSPTVAAGECVQVTGEVTEYYAKTELNWLTTITRTDACHAQAVNPVELPWLRPGDDPVASLEAYEGMVVRLARMEAIAHSPTKHFASGETEIAFLPLVWQRYLGPVHIFHNQPEVSGLLYLSNRLGATLPVVQWGDRLQMGGEGLVGVLDYNFGKYQLLPLPGQAIAAIPSSPLVQTEYTPPPLHGDEYGVCTFNLHGLGRGLAQFPDDGDYRAALSHRAALIADKLATCTILALQETGTPDDADALAAVLLAEHGLGYRAVSLASPHRADEAFPLTNSLLVDMTRVTVEMVESVTGCAATDFGIFAPGTCNAGTFPVFDRPPLLVRVAVVAPVNTVQGAPQTLWIINNHWKSKSGDESANARLRAAQSQVVAARVQAILASDADAQIVVLGDLNDFYGGEAVAALQAATGLFQPYDWLPPLTRYTYIFNGAAQVLDHALVTPNLARQLAYVQILHMQADRAAGTGPLAGSDHDPVVLHIRPAGAANIGGTLTWGALEIVAYDATGTEVTRTITDPQGEYRLWGLPLGTVTLTATGPEWIVLDTPDGLAAEVETQIGMVMPDLLGTRHITAIGGAWLALNTSWLVNSGFVNALDPE